MELTFEFTNVDKEEKKQPCHMFAAYGTDVVGCVLTNQKLSSREKIGPVIYKFYRFTENFIQICGT